MLPPEPRLPGARTYIDRWEYFIVHAPRQSGKTTALVTLARQVTAEGQHAALSVSCENAGEVGDDIRAASGEILGAIRRAARDQLPKEAWPPEPWPESTPGGMIFAGLQDWAVACPLPLVLLFDEIDALEGRVLRSVLHQLRDGHQYRAHAFPSSVVVCGLRDIRDYKAASGGNPDRLIGPSPFNVAVDSLRLGDFTKAEIAELYGQHTADTGQEFTPEAVERAFFYSQGQPWLVNGLAAEIVDKMRVPRPEPITAAHVDTAKERLISERTIHLDSLSARLQEPRVRRVIEPIIAGTFPAFDNVYTDDVAYVRDLGLIARDRPARIANPIYREVIARVLGDRFEEAITANPHALTLPDGQLDVPKMLAEFARFWVMNGEWMASDTGYNEAGAQIVFMAFLHRMVNGDGWVDREFAIGSGRADILVRRRYGAGKTQHAAFELKVWRDKAGDPLAEALHQFDGYLDRFGLDTGTLVIFDRRKNADPIHERTEITTARSDAGRTLTLLRG